MLPMRLALFLSKVLFLAGVWGLTLALRQHLGETFAFKLFLSHTF